MCTVIFPDELTEAIVIIFILNDPGAVGYLRDISIFIISWFTTFVNPKWIYLTILYPATKNGFWHYAKSTMKAAGYIISGNFGMALIKNNPKAEPMRRSAKVPLGEKLFSN